MELSRDRGGEMLARNGLTARIRGDECRRVSNGDDARTGEIDVRQRGQVNARMYRRVRWKGARPQPQSLGHLRSREMQQHVESPDERRIDFIAQVAGEDREPTEGIDPL